MYVVCMGCYKVLEWGEVGNVCLYDWSLCSLVLYICVWLYECILLYLLV